MSNEFTGRDEFLASKDRRYTVVPVLGKKYRIRSLSEAEKSAFETDLYNDGKGTPRERMLRAKPNLMVLCLVDAEGNRLLRDGDAAEIGEVDGLLTSKIYDAAWIHCGFAKDDVENLAKNSPEIRDDGSPSD